MGADPLAQMPSTGWTVLHTAAANHDTSTQELIFRLKQIRGEWKDVFYKIARKKGTDYSLKDLDPDFLSEMGRKLNAEQMKMKLDQSIKTKNNSFRALIVLVTLADVYEPVIEHSRNPRKKFTPKDNYKKYNDRIEEEIKICGIEVDVVRYERARWPNFQDFITYLKAELGKEGRNINFYGIMMWLVTAHGVSCTKAGGDIFNIYDDSQTNKKQTERDIMESVCVFQDVVDKFLPTSRENRHISRQLQHINQFFFFECCRVLDSENAVIKNNSDSCYERPSYIGRKIKFSISFIAIFDTVIEFKSPKS